MNLLDTVVVSLFLVLILFTFVMSRVFSTDLVQVWKGKRFARLAERVCWEDVDYTFHSSGLVHKIYGVEKPAANFSNASMVVYVDKCLKSFVKVNGLPFDSKVLADAMVKCNNGHLNMYSLKDLGGGFVSLEEAAVFVREGFNLSDVGAKRSRGLSVAQILESKDMPLSWAESLYAGSTV